MQKDIRQFLGYIQTHCTYICFEKAPPHEMSESPKPSIFQLTEIIATLFNTNFGTKVYGKNIYQIERIVPCTFFVKTTF